ncbi:MAG: LysE family transporter [Verrucomicrobia bacterium]|nr:LysE family transporter [Verrucomicrobiota bacterium]
MPELSPIFVAWLTGFVSGLLLCIPVGPVNLTIMNEGARRGFKWAALIGAGATVMELIYCSIAFTGFAVFFQKGGIKAAMEVFSFAFLLFLGFKFLLAKNVTAPMHFGKVADKIEERIEEKLHPHSAFMIGFVQTLANPGVLLGWVIIGANFLARGWVEPNWEGKLSFLSGVAQGVGLWFLGLSWAISLGHKKISEKTLLRMQRGSGIMLLALAFAHGGHIAWQLAKARM